VQLGRRQAVDAAAAVAREVFLLPRRVGRVHEHEPYIPVARLYQLLHVTKLLGRVRARARVRLRVRARVRPRVRARVRPRVRARVRPRVRVRLRVRVRVRVRLGCRVTVGLGLGLAPGRGGRCRSSTR
jgi:hypothetical protein